MTSGRTQFSWSPELDAELTRLWGERSTASEISAMIGKSRAAVLGRARRMNLPMRRPSMTGAQAGTMIRTHEAPPTRRRVPQRRPAKVTARRPVRKTYKRQTTLLPGNKSFLTGPAWAPIPGSAPVSLVDLDPGMCRWPLGDGHPFLFCGLATSEGSYCPHHAAVSAGTMGEAQDAH